MFGFYDFKLEYDVYSVILLFNDLYNASKDKIWSLLTMA